MELAGRLAACAACVGHRRPSATQRSSRPSLPAAACGPSRDDDTFFGWNATFQAARSVWSDARSRLQRPRATARGRNLHADGTARSTENARCRLQSGGIPLTIWLQRLCRATRSSFTINSGTNRCPRGGMSEQRCTVTAMPPPGGSWRWAAGGRRRFGSRAIRLCIVLQCLTKGLKWPSKPAAPPMATAPQGSAGDEGAAAIGLADLPQHVLATIAAQLSQRDRAALVSCSRELRTASEGWWRTVEASLDSQAAADSLGEWLRRRRTAVALLGVQCAARDPSTRRAIELQLPADPTREQADFSTASSAG